MKEIISVIVPVYNVEAYLDECVQSLLDQTYPHLEIILVDDGSTDRSGIRCDEFATKDSRIRVIHQKNAGAAAAKNAGLRIATGSYLTFLDSDDLVEPDAYEHMMAHMQLHDADVVQCGLCNFFADGSKENICPAADAVYTVQEYMLRYTTDWTAGLMTDKLFRRSLFDGVFFLEGNKIDDEFFTYRGVMNANLIAQSPKIIYHYRQRQTSVMLNPASAQRIVIDKLNYLPQRREAVIAKFPALRHDFDLHFLNMLLALSRDPSATKQSLQLGKQLLRRYSREKGRTLPSKGLLFKLTVMSLTPVSLLLKQKEPMPEPAAKPLFP